jgi:hypothetical protein
MIGGSLGFEKEKLHDWPRPDRVYTSINLAPDFGYFAFTNFAVGLRPQFSYYRAKLDNVFEIFTILLAPYARLYFLPADKQLNFFADASVFGYTRLGKGEDQNSSRNTFYGYTAMAGPVFFINDKVGVEFTLAYWSEFYLPYHTETSNKISSKIGLQVHL